MKVNNSLKTRFRQTLCYQAFPQFSFSPKVFLNILKVSSQKKKLFSIEKKKGFYEKNIKQNQKYSES